MLSTKNNIVAHYLKKIAKVAIAFTVFISLCTLSTQSLAVEKELPKETTVFNQTFSWQAMAGFTLYHTQSPIIGDEQEDEFDHLSISLLLDLYYKGFFIQSNHRRSSALLSGAEIGYQLHVDDNWELDIVRKIYLQGYNPELIIEDKEENVPALAGLKERDWAPATAIRYSYYKDDSILSIDVASLSPWNKANGWLLDLYYNDLIIYKNWDIYVGGSLTYYSNNVMNYYYGISEEEVNQDRAYYNPNAGFKGIIEVYAQYPISQKWYFNVGMSQTYYSNVIGRSPLVDKQHITQLMFGVNYVF